ncbi:MAG TPA: Uma2 family endonuclease [Gemmatimonadaceae bacterium]|nr:Uma2 family endonuclease [Gemmatimonadaceae bacterium]
MPAATTHWTADMVRALPDDGKRYEVVDGELLVAPAPTWDHQRAIRELFLRLHPYITAHRLGQVIWAPADVTFSTTRMVEPDLFVVPLVSGREPRTWEEVGRLLLAVEVLSPSTARADRQVKRRLYQQENVPEYWIVDVDARLIERWRPTDARPEILTERLGWQPDAAYPPIEIALDEYFAEVCGE